LDKRCQTCLQLSVKDTLDPASGMIDGTLKAGLAIA
jgi:hypothetical protein